MRWYARYADPGGRRRAKAFDRRVDAVRFLAQVQTSKMTGTYLYPARARVTLGVWADRWLATQGHLKPSTRARYSRILSNTSCCGGVGVPLGKITHADVAEWVSGIRLAPASVAYVHRVLHLVLELAVRDGRISRNPAVGVRLPKATRGPTYYENPFPRQLWP